MRIIRSTIAANDILKTIQDNYNGFPPDTVCMFEYHGLNDVYKCSNGNLSFFFKIYARDELDPQAIQAEVEILNYLRQSGLSVSYPISKRDGEYLLPIQTEEKTRFGVMWSAAEGIPYQNDTLDEGAIIRISHLISNMHTILDAIPTSPHRWNLDEHLFLDHSLELLAEYSQINPLVDLPFLQQVVSELKEQIQANAKNWNWGLCHGDIYSGNIHWSNEGNLTIFDFDFCGYGWRAYDVSPILANFGAGTRADSIDQRKKRLENFLRGYKHAGGFSDVEVKAILKIFVPFRRIFNLGYLYNELYYVWGNKLRNEQINLDTKLLRDWIDYYW